MPTINASPPRTTTRAPSSEPMRRRAFTSWPESSSPAANVSSGAYFKKAFLYSTRCHTREYSTFHVSRTSEEAEEQKARAATSSAAAHRLARLFGGPSFFGNLATTILIFLVLMSVYSLIRGLNQPSNSIPLSVVAADVAAGKVKSIVVDGRLARPRLSSTARPRPR
jgi:hypothetical protein